MFNFEKQCAMTAHSSSIVPFVLCDDRAETLIPCNNNNNALCDIAPTILEVLDIKKPIEMTGKSLIAEWKNDKK